MLFKRNKKQNKSNHKSLRSTKNTYLFFFNKAFDLSLKTGYLKKDNRNSSQNLQINTYISKINLKV